MVQYNNEPDQEKISQRNQMHTKRNKEKERNNNREYNSLAPRNQPYKREKSNRNRDY